MLTDTFKLENQVKSSYEKESGYRLEGKYLFGQFAGAAGIDEARRWLEQNKMDFATEALFEHFRDRVSTVSFLHNSEIKEIREKFASHPEAMKAAASASAEAMAHSFNLHGIKTHKFSSSIDWFCDFNGGDWPCLPARHFIELLNSDAGMNTGNVPGISPELTWALNEHYNFVDLSKAFWLSGNDNFASEAMIQAIEWGAANPLWLGINWVNFDNIAIRAFNWMVMLNLCLASPLFTPGIFAKIMPVLIMHGAAMAWHLNTQGPYSLASASVLYMLSCSFPELKLSKRWRTLAETRLAGIIHSEFGENGFHLSGSVSAHCAAAEWLLLPIVQHRRLNSAIQPPSCLINGICKVLDALQAIGGPGLVLPDLGKKAQPGILGRRTDLKEYAKILLCMGAAAFEHSEWRCDIDTMPAELFWWFGPNIEELLNSLERKTPSDKYKCSYFVENGLGVIRDEWTETATQCIVCACPPADISKHIYVPPDPHQPASVAHCDFLSVIITIGNEPFLIEPGCDIHGSRFNTYLNNFLAHSVPLLSDEIVPFKVGRLEDLDDKLRQELRANGASKADLPDNRSLCAPLYMQKVGQDTLFKAERQARLKNGLSLSIVREMLFRPDAKILVIRDTISGNSGQEEIGLESSLLFSPHLRLNMRGDMGCMVRSNSKKIAARVMPLFPKGSRYLQKHGSMAQPPTGLFFRNGQMHGTNQIRYFCKSVLPLTTYIVVDWTRKEPPRYKRADLDLMFRGG